MTPTSVLLRSHRLVVSAAVLLSVVGVFSAGAGASTLTGRALLDKALETAKTSGWVHEGVQVKQKGVVVQDSLDDIGTTEGVQYVSTLGGGASEVIAFDQSQTLYVRANALGLTAIYQLSSADAATYNDEWMSLTPSDTEYSSIAYATTLASDFGQVRFSGEVTESGLRTVDGRRVHALSGIVPPIDGAPKFNGTLYVRATGKPLPVLFVESDAKNKVSVTWSNWGHHYVLTTPTGAVAWPTT
jgi:hypothetical protein